MTSNNSLGLGLIGCGNFGRFCLEAYAKVKGVHLVAVADPIKEAADATGLAFGLPVHYDAEELIRRDDVGIVHLATPPFNHHALGLAAAHAGKHVLCEKPLAVTMAEADDLLVAARKHKVIIPVNFVLRHNPVSEAVRTIIKSEALGKVLYASLENWAQDEGLGPDHWFWDKHKSGGIFIEHGVHFFDLYDWWLGPAKIVSAHVEVRPGTTQEDRVMCTLRYENGAAVNHYHGFDQPARLDRTTHRILFERGDMIVEGWIPVGLTLHAIADDTTVETLTRLCEGCQIELIEKYDASHQACRGRGQSLTVTQKIRLQYPAQPIDKQALYARSVGDLLADQLRYIDDRSHQRKVGEENGRASLGLAVAAAEMALR